MGHMALGVSVRVDVNTALHVASSAVRAHVRKVGGACSAKNPALKGKYRYLSHQELGQTKLIKPIFRGTTEIRFFAPN